MADVACKLLMDMQETLLKMDNIQKFGEALLSEVQDGKKDVGALRKSLELSLEFFCKKHGYDTIEVATGSEEGFIDLKDQVEFVREQLCSIRDRSNALLVKIGEWNKEGMIKGLALRGPEGDEVVEALPQMKVLGPKIKETFKVELEETKREGMVEDNFEVEEGKMSDQDMKVIASGFKNLLKEYFDVEFEETKSEGIIKDNSEVEQADQRNL